VLNSNTFSTCPGNMVNFGRLAAEIGLPVWGTPANFNGIRILGSVTARHSSSRRQPKCGVEQRAPPIFDRAAITLGIGPHFYLWYLLDEITKPLTSVCLSFQILSRRRFPVTNSKIIIDFLKKRFTVIGLLHLANHFSAKRKVDWDRYRIVLLPS